MVLDRNPDNFFAETEQVAFHPGHVVPGIDFTNDPLLQGRLFSYTDTQLLRLGGANFHEIPINRPEVPDAQLPARRRAADGRQSGAGRLRAQQPRPGRPARDAAAGFTSFPAARRRRQGARTRPETFADHYSQARLFWRSMTEPEQRHIVSAFTFELSKVSTVAVRRRMLGHLVNIDAGLCTRVWLPGWAWRARPRRSRRRGRRST